MLINALLGAERMAFADGIYSIVVLVRLIIPEVTGCPIFKVTILARAAITISGVFEDDFEFHFFFSFLRSFRFRVVSKSSLKVVIRRPTILPFLVHGSQRSR
jgi:hypothetical protein